MAKKMFASLGILVVLLLSFGITSATEFQLDIIGGTLIGEAGDIIPFTVNLTSNETNEVYVNWTTTNPERITSLAEANNYTAGNSHTVSGFNLTIPTSGTSVTIKAHVYDASTLTELYVISEQVNFQVTPTSDTLCELEGYTEKGKLEITDFDVNNNGEGKDDEWQYLDQIEIQVEVENTDNDDDIEDVEVMIMILDNKIEDDGNDITNDFDIDDEVLDDIGKLKDGDQETVTFIIDELPSDLDDGTYYMYIMAYEDGNEANQCASEIDSGDYYFEFTVESVDYEESIVVRGSEFENIINTYCGQQNLEIVIPVYNLGEDDEEKILVNLYDSEMGIDEYIIIDDLDNGDREVITFFINIPSELSKEKYTLDVIVSFDWDDDEDDEDPLSYDEETSDTSIRLNILGCKAPTPTITANLESSAQVGQDLVVKAKITNNGKTNDFIISASDFDSWASMVSINPQTTSIEKGEFQEVLITLSPMEAGSQSFKINTIVDGSSHEQTISVNITEKPGIFGFASEMNNVIFYTVIGIVALLVLIFLVLIVKISKRTPSA
ncbi:putative S-layer protein [Candidatus Pacearchaeota archaeon]|nr:putative S-layer protein [Candidatus Pacearchaeota archaeon]